MRKTTLWAVLLASAVLTACSQKVANPGVAVQEKEDEGLTVGVCIYDYQDEFMELYRKELRKYLEEEYGILAEIMDGQGNEEIQTDKLEKFLEKKPDAVILNPVNAQRTSAMVDMCWKQGVPVTVINREPPEEEIERWEEDGIMACYIGADREQAGICQGEIILDTKDRGDRNEDGVISCVMITGDDDNPDFWSRRESARRTLEEAGFSVDILFEESGDGEMLKAERLAAEALTIYGEKVEVIFCGNDEMALGAEKAIRQAGRTVGEDVYLVGVDALREAVALVEEGRMTGTVFNDYKTQARMAADAAVAMAGGEEQEPAQRVGYIKIVQPGALPGQLSSNPRE